GQHACLVADALGISRVFIHPFSGVLSAYGMKLAALRAIRHCAINSVLGDALAKRLAQTAEDLAVQARPDVEAQGGRNIAVTRTAHLRYSGSDTTLPVPLGNVSAMVGDFASEHARQFGFGFGNKALIVEALEIEAYSREDPEIGGEAAHKFAS